MHRRSARFPHVPVHCRPVPADGAQFVADYNRIFSTGYKTVRSQGPPFEITRFSGLSPLLRERAAELRGTRLRGKLPDLRGRRRKLCHQRVDRLARHRAHLKVELLRLGQKIFVAHGCVKSRA
jgi:hypothetical protein